MPSVCLSGEREMRRVEFALECFNALPGHMLCVCVSCAVHITADRRDQTGTAETVCGFIPGLM